MSGIPSANAWTQWGRDHGTLHSRPQVGDVVVYGSAHVGLVVKVRDSNHIDTIEGNFSNKVSHNFNIAVSNARGSGEPAGITGFVSPY